MKSLRVKILLICALIIVLPSLSIGIAGNYLYQSELNTAGNVQLKNSVNLVNSMINTLDTQVKEGELTLEAAQEMVRVEILGEKNSDGTRPISSNFDLGENGYFFVINNAGELIAHPKLEGENIWDSMSSDGKPVGKSLVEKADEGGGVVRYDWPLPSNPDKSAEKITYITSENNWGWGVSAGSYLQDFNQSAMRIVYLILTALGSLIVIVIITYVFIRQSVIQPITKISRQVNIIASGDLTADDVKVKSKDEVGELASAVNQMVEYLRTTLRSVKEASEYLAASSQELSASSEESTQANQQVATAMSDAVQGAERQLINVNESLLSIRKLAKSLGEVADFSISMAKSTETANGAEQVGSERVEEVVQTMNEISVSVDETSSLINQLQQHSEKVGDITKMIKDIADQTSLLALNAAIESARAGEAGRGFAVVSDEIRKLAESSKTSASQITEMISNIQNETSKVVFAMNTNRRNVTEGLTSTENIKIAFRDIKKSIENLQNESSYITNLVQVMDSESKQIVELNEEVQGIAQSTTTISQETAAASEEQLATMEEISVSAQSLSTLAEGLNESLNQFTLHR